MATVEFKAGIIFQFTGLIFVMKVKDLLTTKTVVTIQGKSQVIILEFRISFVIVVTNSFKFDAKVIIAREIIAAIAVRSAFIIFDTKG